MYKTNIEIDKSGKYFIMIVIFGFLFTIFGIWTSVEFILYLFKDHPFNWWSLGLTVVTIILELYYFIKMMLNDA